MIYTAVILEKTSCQLLTWAMRATANLEGKGFGLKAHDYHLPHHMTINLGEFDIALNHEKVLYCDFAELEIDSLFWSESVGAAAYRVCPKSAWTEDPKFVRHPIKTINDDKSHAHITVALRDGVKPVRSNDLFSEDPLEDLNLHKFNDPLIVRGSVREMR